MNWVDWIVLVVFGFYIFEGIRRGFIEQTLELLGLIIAASLTVLIYKSVGVIIIDKVGISDQLANPIAFFVTYFVIQFIYAFLLKVLYPLIPSFLREALPNKLAGIVPAIGKGIVIVGIVLMIIIALPVPAKLKTAVSESKIGGVFVTKSSWIEAQLAKVFHGDLNSALTFLTVPSQKEQIVQPDQTVQLGFSTDAITVDKDAEQKMFALVSEERVKAGLAPLVWDEKLAEAGRAHSSDMLRNGYFSHTAQDGKSPFDRLDQAKITYTVAGENIALAPTTQLAHDGLMRSPGHRANILEKDFGHLGIGVYDAGIYGKIFSQEFTN